MLRLVLLTLFSFAAMGQMTRVAILDTGIDLNNIRLAKYLCPEGAQNFSASSTAHDFHGHGTNVASIIVENIPSNVCITPFKVFNDDMNLNVRSYIQALKKVFEEGYEYVNMSMQGVGHINREMSYLYSIAGTGTRLSIAAGNNSKDLNKKCNEYPACYFTNSEKQDRGKAFFNVHVVGAADVHSSNRGTSVVTNWEVGDNLGTPPMSGTSQATARHTNLRIRGYYK